MHELALFALPLVGVPLFALQRWLAKAHLRPTMHPGSAPGIGLGETMHLAGTLPNANGPDFTLGNPAKATVLVFMSNRCPGVKAYDGRLRDLARRFGPQGVEFVGVNSVPDHLYPSESLAGMRRAAKARGLPFPYVKDRDQALMRRLGAVCTPHVFLLDQDLALRYRGRIDDAFLEARARSHDLRDALNDVLAHRPVARPETHPLGCAIDVAPSPTFPSHPRSVPA